LEAAVAEQPFREHLRGQLILALYRCGRQAEALDAYRSARRTLVEEIGVEPGPELRALHQAILAQDPALDPPPGPEDLPPALAGGSPILAGRDAELAELVALLAEACEGRGGVAFVSGLRGIGKTRLAGELAREALRRRIGVFYIGAHTPPDEALGAVRHVEDRPSAALLVVDDADDASAAVLDRAAALAADSARRSLLFLVLHRGPELPPAFSGRTGRRLELGPLGSDAVGQIARLHMPSGDVAPPVEALAAESGGVPLAAHRTAAAWARSRA
jgi:Bacterial transcriptional activator domain/AAA ATPase domain